MTYFHEAMAKQGPPKSQGSPMTDKPDKSADTEPQKRTILDRLYLATSMTFDGSTQSMLQSQNGSHPGYRIEIRPELQGCVAAKPGGEVHWIPFAICKNGVFKSKEAK